MEDIEFSQEQDLLLLQQAVVVSPFSQGKGQGWKMIAQKLMRLSDFSSRVKPKIVRERILSLMNDYCKGLPESLEEDSYSEYTGEMNTLLQKLVDLRDEALKMVGGSSSDPGKDYETGEVSGSTDGGMVTETEGKSCEIRHEDNVRVAKKPKQESREQNESSLVEPESSTPTGKGNKRKRQVMAKGNNKNEVMKFLEEREAKRLQLREEEIALRREELAERKKLVQLLEQRLDEEKNIRENLFNVMNELLKK